ncbi:MAG: FG-GAP repeat protein, partial [Phycisphaerales bacterium]
MKNRNILHLLSACIVAVLNGAAWGQCEVAQIFSQGGFGRVSIDGDVAVIGDADAFDSLGAAFVYRRGLGGPQDWTLQATLMAPEPDQDDQFGSAVAVGAGVIVVGAYTTDTTAPQGGAAYTYRYDDDVWQYETMLTASDSQPGAIFGFSAAMDGDVILIGARDDPNEGVFQSGSAYVFRFDPDSSAWIEEAKLVDPEHEPCDLFGVSVSTLGDVALVGAHGNDDVGFNSGAAFVFRRTGAKWTLEQKLMALDAENGDRFGFSVSLGDGGAIVGAYLENSTPKGQDAGAAYLFRFDGRAWFQEQKIIASDADPIDWFGRAVAINPATNVAVVGASNDEELGFEAGSGYVFRYSDGIWSQASKVLASDGAAGDHFGGFVALSQDVAVIKGGGKGYIFAGIQGIDCNENGEPDACDIFDGTSDDQDGN